MLIELWCYVDYFNKLVLCCSDEDKYSRCYSLTEKYARRGCFNRWITLRKFCFVDTSIVSFSCCFNFVKFVQGLSTTMSSCSEQRILVFFFFFAFQSMKKKFISEWSRVKKKKIKTVHVCLDCIHAERNEDNIRIVFVLLIHWEFRRNIHSHRINVEIWFPMGFHRWWRNSVKQFDYEFFESSFRM